MAKVIYRGPHEAVDVGGSGLIAERDGDPVEVGDELAEELAGSDSWEIVEGKTSAKSKRSSKAATGADDETAGDPAEEG